MRPHRINPLSLNDPRPPKLVREIYAWKDPGDGWYRYVGQTNDVELRLKQHLTDKWAHGNYAKQRWLDDLKQRGLEPIVETLQKCQSQEEADKAEREHIRRLINEGHPLFNRVDGGLGNRSASRIRSARLADWIEIGYLFKSTRDQAAHCVQEMQGMLPKRSREIALFEAALKKLDQATWLLEHRVEAEYPNWVSVTKVFAGPTAEHFKRLGPDLVQLETEINDARMSAEDLGRLMMEHPDLMMEGFAQSALGPKARQAELGKLRDESRQRLHGSLDSCNEALGWLAGIERSVSLTKKYHSGDIKNFVERSTGVYVSEGALIAAAIWRGFRFRRIDSTTGVYFNMSTRSLEGREGLKAVTNVQTTKRLTSESFSKLGGL